MNFTIPALVILVAGCVNPSLIWGQENRSELPVPTFDSIMIAEGPVRPRAKVDLGGLKHGEIHRLKVNLFNATGSDFVVGELTTSCGCLRGSLDTNQWKANELLAIDLTLDLEGTARQASFVRPIELMPPAGVALSFASKSATGSTIC